MNKAGLKAIVRDGLDDPNVLGRIACKLRDDDSLVQAHNDGRDFRVGWGQHLGYLRCTIFVGATDDALAQIDIHDDGDVRVEAWEPLSVTISPSEDLICLTRFRLG
ncbi:MAG: hypothetical protein LAN18_06210 [Acidobacteriia bacterium]|nr:hypothetical protein [Terriglobia bacterium]